MDDQEIRWKQRFGNYKKALAKLGEAVQLDAERELSELEKQGIIQAFEYTHTN
jgi:lipase chaperone LimK